MLGLSANSMNKEYPQHPARLRLREPSLNRFHCLYWWFFMLSTDLFYASIGGFLTFHAAFNANLLQRVLPYFVQVLTWIAYLPEKHPDLHLGFYQKSHKLFLLINLQRSTGQGQSEITHFLSGQNSLP